MRLYCTRTEWPVGPMIGFNSNSIVYPTFGSIHVCHTLEKSVRELEVDLKLDT